MKKTLRIWGFFATLILSPFSSMNAFAGSFIIEVPDTPEPKTQTIAYRCDAGTSKERVEAVYLNADNISLLDFKWKGDRVIAANVIANIGKKYEGEGYIWWENNNEVTLHDRIRDPEGKKLIRCKDETTLLF
ncbi:MliC family protein [Bartonella vinsonii]|uniref:Lysozyme inhibitor n=1 Tax=Bartonella vinsonii TaxID=33047 RepID=A0A448V4A9_BARVI|nr:MliC family protein [Bartonella vinsonii]VEJ44568.1 lysozyme inhibitor [Bartonella vinsonii]